VARGSWFGEGDYAPIAEKIFNAIDVDGFLLEFDGDRSGGFEPLRFMPRNKTVVLGLVTTKTGPPEKIDGLLRRIEEASTHFPMENLAISPQCGFATFLRETRCPESSSAASWSWWWRRLGVLGDSR